MQLHGLTYGEIDRSLSLLALLAEDTRLSYRWRPQLKDPSDEHVLDAAINGHAAAIVTFNLRDFLPAAGRFGLQAAEPGVILKQARHGHE